MVVEIVVEDRLVSIVDIKHRLLKDFSILDSKIVIVVVMSHMDQLAMTRRNSL